MRNTLTSTLIKATLATGMALLLAACGGGSSSTGTLNLAITDDPIDYATAVVVEFTGVELQKSDGGRIDKDFPLPRKIDLQKLTE